MNAEDVLKEIKGLSPEEQERLGQKIMTSLPVAHKILLGITEGFVRRDYGRMADIKRACRHPLLRSFNDALIRCCNILEKFVKDSEAEAMKQTQSPPVLQLVAGQPENSVERQMT